MRSECASPSEEEVAQLESFPAADDDYRSLRLRCAKLCAALNAQSLSVSKEERARAWYEWVHGRDLGMVDKSKLTVEYHR